MRFNRLSVGWLTPCGSRRTPFRASLGRVLAAEHEVVGRLFSRPNNTSVSAVPTFLLPEQSVSCVSLGPLF